MSADFRSRPLVPCILVAVVASGCEVGPRSVVAPSGARASFSAAQPFVPVNGTTTISLELRGPDGSAVPDDTAAIVQATRGLVTPQKVRTQSGRATVTYRAPAQHGLDTVRATSGEIRAEVEVAVGSRPIQRMTLNVSPATLPPQGGDSQIVATVLGPDDSGVAGAPVRFQTSKGVLSTTQPIYTGDDGVARASITTDETAEVSARVFDLHSAEATLRVRKPTTLNVTASPAQAQVGGPVTFTIVASNPDVDSPSGELTVNFGDGIASDLGQISGKATLTHTYGFPGTFHVSVWLKEADGIEATATLQVTVKAVEGQPPKPPKPPTPDDQINPNEVTWLHTNVAGWAQTSTITNVRITSSEICVDHTKAGRFPTSQFGSIIVEGNVWVFAKFGNRWHGATYDWLRPGQVCKGVTGDELGRDQIRIPPMDASWAPRSGDEIGFMVSTRARDSVRAGEERTNIVVVRWP